MSERPPFPPDPLTDEVIAATLTAQAQRITPRADALARLNASLDAAQATPPSPVRLLSPRLRVHWIAAMAAAVVLLFLATIGRPVAAGVVSGVQSVTYPVVTGFQRAVGLPTASPPLALPVIPAATPPMLKTPTVPPATPATAAMPVTAGGASVGAPTPTALSPIAETPTPIATPPAAVGTPDTSSGIPATSTGPASLTPSAQPDATATKGADMAPAGETPVPSVPSLPVSSPSVIPPPTITTVAPPIIIVVPPAPPANATPGGTVMVTVTTTSLPTMDGATVSPDATRIPGTPPPSASASRSSTPPTVAPMASSAPGTNTPLVPTATKSQGVTRATPTPLASTPRPAATRAPTPAPTATHVPTAPAKATASSAGKNGNGSNGNNGNGNGNAGKQDATLTEPPDKATKKPK